MGLSLPLKIFSFSIPFYVMLTMGGQIFRGFDRADAEVFFNNIGRNLVFLLFLVPLFLLPVDIIYVAYAYLGSFLVLTVLFIFFMRKELPFEPKLSAIDLAVGKSLLLFSLPLMGNLFSSQIMTWADTFLLGVYKASDVVGLYNGAVPLARFIPFFLGSMLFVYTPVVSTLYAKRNFEEINTIYPVVTKWVFLMSLPLLFVFLIFPENVLGFLFGLEYVDAWLVLIIVSLATFIHTFLGANAQTLTSFGYTRIQLYATWFAVLVNIVLNIVLIPVWGIVGAAVATAVSLIIINLIYSVKLYRGWKVHPFSIYYLKTIMITGAVMFLFYIVVKGFVHTIIGVVISTLVFMVLVFFMMLILGCISKEDVRIMVLVEEQAGIDLRFLKRIMKRFI